MKCESENGLEMVANVGWSLWVISILHWIVHCFGFIHYWPWRRIFFNVFTYSSSLQELKLRPNSRTYEAWKNPPIPLTLDIYLFNWTNPEDFFNSTTRPHVQQLGPYVFTEKPDKVNITWHPENSTVSFMKKSRFYFDAEKSKGSLDDNVTSLNVVALVSQINSILILSCYIIPSICFHF